MLRIRPETKSGPATGQDDNDTLLVQRAQNDLSAFTALYDRHVDRVYRYLLVRVANVHDAQDLTSQTFIAAMESLDRYRGQSPFIAWLIGIARHKLMDQYRSSRPTVELDEAEEMVDADLVLEEEAQQKLDFDVVRRKMNLLAPDRAEAISLRFFAGLEVAEISSIMGRNEPAVRMLVFRGLRDLQNQLNWLQED